MQFELFCNSRNDHATETSICILILQLEEWWDNVFFYDQRVPLPIYYSPVGTFPKEDFKDKLSQLKYAARLITNMVKIKEEIDK